ncbi:single-strand DNA-binding protein [Luteibacter sp. Sphag1AF]|uniref:single-stranded DNA-binding protein n=1 Tax=Luteibacter sp. Sphag1AF TaxID=2587031 RepID=UPI001622BB58|nr:single-stranded DNA-binding protein [Luteibacter sp. Sphag1AF]MBB3227044.1 single-strand DNA-binding protein [Luteibacter sp. Sphag1AF]
MSINVFTFSGRIGRDAEVRRTSGGKVVTGFPVAVDVGYGDNKSTLWVDCSMWGERGERLAEYLPKGSLVTVTGEADMQTYQSSGQDKAKLTCRVNDVQLPPLNKDRQEKPRQDRQESRSTTPVNDGFDEDDIPF